MNPEPHRVHFGKFTDVLKQQAVAVMASEPRILLGPPPPAEAEIGTAVYALLSDPRLLPINRTMHEAFRGLSERFGRPSPGGDKVARKHGSLVWDTRHVVAAGFADVFTCDKLVDDVIGDFRIGLGLPRQLSVKGCGSQGALVAALRV
jgi:hypothetical protein